MIESDDLSQITKLEELVKEGRLKFVLKRGILFFALPVGILAYYLENKLEYNLNDILFYTILFTLMGIMSGLAWWWVIKKKLKKLLNENL